MERDEILDIKMAILSLGKREKEVILSYFFKGMSEKEIAKYLSISQQRVNIIKKKALLKLEKFLS